MLQIPFYAIIFPSYKYLCHLGNKNNFLDQISLSHIALNKAYQFFNYRTLLIRSFTMSMYCGIQEQKTSMIF